MIMDVNVWKSAKNKKIKSESGQAIFEFIIFLPFFILFFAVMVSVVGGINASINQQKTLRGYFFYSIRNNSTLPFNQDMDSYLSKGIRSVGAYSFGFSKEQRGESQLGPCFRVPSLRPRDDTCDNGIEDTVSGLIKVFSAYGVCSASYIFSENNVFVDNLSGVSISSSCSLSN
ncbi:MAG: hypothetical protein CME68_11515 [Halobacteriovoraceae bacterium]|nr:hypothetical protein [Halobacteriovoraceae bacterium]